MWGLAEAKNKFSEVFTKAMTDGPQVITRRGEEAVLIKKNLIGTRRNPVRQKRLILTR